LGHIEYTKWTKNGSTISANDAYRVSTDTVRKNHKKYYVPVAGHPGIYEVYLEEEFESGKTIYERFSVYSLPIAGSIVGTYKAYARNKTSKNLSNEIESSECIIPGPSSISYATNGNLNSSALPKEGDNGVALEVKVNQTNAADSLIYEWYYDRENANMSGAGEPIENADGATYSIQDAKADAGYYKVIVKPERNRAVGNAIESNICRVTGQPEIPVIEAIKIEPGAAEGDIDNHTLTTLTAQTSKTFGQHESDELTYKWYG
jgi:hypothetical protein